MTLGSAGGPMPGFVLCLRMAVVAHSAQPDTQTGCGPILPQPIPIATNILRSF